NLRGLGVLWRLIRHYGTQSSAAWKFFLSCLAKALGRSPRLIAQTTIYLGMYLHFCKVHGDELSWNPWARDKGRASSAQRGALGERATPWERGPKTGRAAPTRLADHRPRCEPSACPAEGLVLRRSVERTQG